MNKALALLSIPVFLALHGCGGSAKTQDPGAPAAVPDWLPGVKIVYSANVNGELEPCGCRSNPTGGIDRRYNLEAQKISGLTLKLESGDLFYKSTPVPPFLEKQWNYQAEVLVKAYNEFGVEVFAPGELDFAAGFEQFQKLAAQAKFKVISSNLLLRSSGKPAFATHLILEKGGKKVGLFALIDESLDLPQELAARKHVEAASEMVKLLRPKVDVLFALTHLGLDKDIELAKEVKGIDAIFGAHSQSFIVRPEKSGDTYIFQPSFRGQHLGVVSNGENAVYQVDERFDSGSKKSSPIDKLVIEAKAEIARLNTETDNAILTGTMPPKANAEYQTFARCAECHEAQHGFHSKTPHFSAFETLVKANQASNKECLGCHTAGANKPGGWSDVKKLVLNAAGKAVPAESFVKTVHKLSPSNLTRTSKAFINVQCENCHGPAGDHPFGAKSFKPVTVQTCVQCHTPDRAPGWYSGSKLDEKKAKEKLKSMSCPGAKKG